MGNGDLLIKQGEKLFLLIRLMMMFGLSGKGYLWSKKIEKEDSSIKQEKKLLLSFMMRLVISVKGYIGSKRMRNMDSSTNKVFLPIPHLSFSQL